MMRVGFVLSVAVAIQVLSVSVAVAQPPLRDAQRATTGTAGLSGIVVSDGREPRPLRRARVMINNAERTVGRTIVTDESGTFEISDLPAGRYTVTATKDGLVTVTYGARRLGRPGTPVVLADGQQITGLTLRIPRGAVITGTFLDENGQPLPGAFVRVSRSVLQNGERLFVPAGSAQPTDDRGIFRIYGLMPGEYVVSGSASIGQAPPSPEVRVVSEEEVRRALNEIRTPLQSLRPGQPVYDPPTVRTSDESATVAYAPVYYPGVLLPDQAARLTLSAGEERGGVDFQMQMVRTATIEGTVAAPAGVSPQVSVMMLAANSTMIPSLDGHFKTARADPTGRFTFASVPPGQYSVMARGGTASPQRPGPGNPQQARQPTYWAQSDIIVDGRDMSDVLLSLQSGLTISGSVRFESSSLAPPEDLSRLRVSLRTAQSQGEIRLGVSPAQVEKDGRFTIAGVIPGRYRLGSGAPLVGGAPVWFLKSAIADGRDVLDAPFEVQHTRPTGHIVLTFTDRPSVLTGIVRDESGSPAPDYYIVTFAADRTTWGPQSRRIAAVRPSGDGRYTFRNLPPGDYLVAVVEDAEEGEWYDPAFLQALVASSIKVAIAEGEQTTQDLKLAAAR